MSMHTDHKYLTDESINRCVCVCVCICALWLSGRWVCSAFGSLSLLDICVCVCQSLNDKQRHGNNNDDSQRPFQLYNNLTLYDWNEHLTSNKKTILFLFSHHYFFNYMRNLVGAFNIIAICYRLCTQIRTITRTLSTHNAKSLYQLWRIQQNQNIKLNRNPMAHSPNMHTV